jgi:hypothetical protein
LLLRRELDKGLVLKNLELHQANQDQKAPESDSQDYNRNPCGFDTISAIRHMIDN